MELEDINFMAGRKDQSRPKRHGTSGIFRLWSVSPDHRVVDCTLRPWQRHELSADCLFIFLIVSSSIYCSGCPQYRDRLEAASQWLKRSCVYHLERHSVRRGQKEMPTKVEREARELYSRALWKDAAIRDIQHMDISREDTRRPTEKKSRSWIVSRNGRTNV